MPTCILTYMLACLHTYSPAYLPTYLHTFLLNDRGRTRKSGWLQQDLIQHRKHLLRISISMYMFICMSICICTCTCIRTCVYMYICIYVYVYVYVRKNRKQVHNALREQGQNRVPKEDLTPKWLKKLLKTPFC